MDIRTSGESYSGDIKYWVIFSKRRSISIIVNANKEVIVRAPRNFSMKKVDSFVESKSQWIKKHINSFSEVTRLNHNKNYADGEIHPFMGRELVLKINKAMRSSVILHDNIFEVSLPETGDGKKIKHLLDKWYSRVAKETLTCHFERTLDRLSRYGFEPAEFKVRSLKSRWGSCSSKGRITISAELIKIDERFHEYVLIHELCHLKHPNHGKDFYRLLEEVLPDYRQVRKELMKISTR